MLVEFSVKNFLSFKEKTTFSMNASIDKSLENNIAEVKNNRILKVTAIYGANASGKSNLFEILAIVHSMIKNSNTLSPNSLLPVTPFKLDKKTINEPSEFEIKFIVKDIKYVYGFKMDKKNIYEEYLYYYPNNRIAKIFTRKNINDYSFTSDEESKLNDIKEKNTNNKFFLSTATNWNYDKTKPAFDFITEKLGVVLFHEQLDGYAYKSYYEDNDKSLEKFALKFLKKADFNISGYQISKQELTDEQLNSFPKELASIIPNNMPFYSVKTKHTIQNDTFELDIKEESLGTQLIFSFIPVIKDVLDNQKVLIIDEFDKSLHPFLVRFIIEIFNDEEVNKNHAQLIFNTHETNILDLNMLRRDQIWFVEKNYENESSTIYPLDDFSVRKNENIEKGYLVGRYGAIPFLSADFSNFIK